MKRIAIFGGSFDPVHLGHIELMKCAKQAADLDSVVAMPCWQSPFKGKTTATGEQRLEMLNLAIEEQGIDDWAEASAYEISRPEQSYSWKTVAELSSQYPDDDCEWFWILGTDQWKQIEKWAEPEKLRQMLHFVVMTRNGQKVDQKKGWRHTAVPFSHAASATKIRTDFEKHKDWLSPKVAKYCERHRIYNQ